MAFNYPWSDINDGSGLLIMVYVCVEVLPLRMMFSLMVDDYG